MPAPVAAAHEVKADGAPLPLVRHGMYEAHEAHRRRAQVRNESANGAPGMEMAGAGDGWWWDGWC